MPYKPQTHNPHRGCVVVHRPHREDNRPNSTQRGYDGVWQRVRAMHLREEPLCRMCQARGRITVATLVDHIIPLPEGTSEDTNLQSLCTRCHSIKHKWGNNKLQQVDNVPNKG